MDTTDDNDFDPVEYVGSPPGLPRTLVVSRDAVHLAAPDSTLAAVTRIAFGHQSRDPDDTIPVGHPAPIGMLWQAIHEMEGDPEAGPWLALGKGSRTVHRYAWGDGPDWLLTTDLIAAVDAEQEREGGVRQRTTLAEAMNALAVDNQLGLLAVSETLWVAKANSGRHWIVSTEPGVCVDWLESACGLRGTLYRSDVDGLCTYGVSNLAVPHLRRKG